MTHGGNCSSAGLHTKIPNSIFNRDHVLSQAFGILQEELGRPIAEVFSSISEKPIAAASLGQVYKAVLRDTSEAVAVKVQRPAVEPIIFKDLFIFRSFARLING